MKEIFIILRIFKLIKLLNKILLPSDVEISNAQQQTTYSYRSISSFIIPIAYTYAFE